MSRRKLLPDGIAEAADIHSALAMLRQHLKRAGVRDLVYGYMLQGKSHIRNDLVFIYTLPDALMDVYFAGGGLNKDPMADDMDDMLTPTLAHLKDMRTLTVAGAKFKFHFAIEAVKVGYTTMLTCPVEEAERMGIAGMTFYQEARENAPDMEADFLWDVAKAFHHSVKTHGQLGAYFGLTLNEKDALSWSSFGRSADDIAKMAEVTPRSIEMRLQSARKKLKAKTTTEAVYKAVANGILPL